MYATEKELQKSEPEDAELIQDLIAARDFMLEHGWIQGRVQSSQGVCIAGSVLYSRGYPRSNETIWGDGRFTRVIQELNKVTHRIAGVGAISYSEHVARSRDDVITVFNEAIARQRGEFVRPAQKKSSIFQRVRAFVYA